MELVEGKLQIKDQAREYIDRGDALDSWSYLDYFLGTYDGLVVKEREHRRGRNPNTRVPYREGANRDGHCRIIKSEGHETMPYFPREWFPKKLEDDHNGLFEAYMLALLKPWRSVTDIKHHDQTFREAYNDFMADAPIETCRIIRNIQFYHECSESAREQTYTDVRVDEPTEVTVWTDGDGESMEGPFNEPEEDTIEHLICEADIDRVIDQPYSPRDQLFADMAIAIGLNAGALEENMYSGPYPLPAVTATTHHLDRFKIWDDVLSNPEFEAREPTPNTTSVLPLNAMSESNEEPSASNLVSELSLAVRSGPILNKRQVMAHTIVTSHLKSYLSQQNPPQRLMIVHGQGGTGKMALLNAISQTFDDLGASALLAKTAMSGVAASIIGGQTLHSWAALPIIAPQTNKWLTHPGKDVKARRQKNMEKVLWLTIDEMSMLTSPMLVLLSQVTGMFRTGIPSSDASTPFGGLNVVLLGDFHQLPPVAKGKTELYHPRPPPPETSNLGRCIYEQFEIVVKLDEQIRIQDQGWNDILQCARTGDCTKDDIASIRKLVLTSPECDIPNFALPPWNEMILVTSRNSVRSSWNDFMVTQHARRTSQIRYVVYARDRRNDGQPLTKQQRLAVAHLKLDETNNLPHKVELVVGMKAMVTLNISPENDLANGSRGIIEDIILNPKERVDASESNIIRLQYPPAVVLFRPLFCRDRKFPGLRTGIVPIFPSHQSFKIGGRSGIRVDRDQIALTAAYAFTDFKSQGQTIESAIVDLAKPPSGSIDGFHAYVALSRSRGMKTIRLLRDFEEKLFTVHPSEHLRCEDVRLERLEMDTQKRYDVGEFNFGNYHS